MKTITPLLAALALLQCVVSQSVNAGELIYSQLSDNQSTFGPSQFWSAASVNSEVADEFNIVGNIDRVSAAGFVWETLDFQGVYVRFYEFGQDNKPGALQREYFSLSANDPNLVFEQFGGIDATLSPVFNATGKHFLSVQPVANYWYWWSSGTNAPRGEAFYFRNNSNGESWHHGDNLNFNTNSDVTFNLYGTVTGAGVITSLSADTLPRSGFLEIFGNNFGNDGTVLIDGSPAPVADWTGTRIVAYVPENALLTTLPVQVVNGAGSSNTLPLAVTERPAASDHVNWRFRMNGPYSFVRPALGSDGTVYSIDKFAHLYALAPNGGLKWLVRGAGDKGVAVGPDGTIYLASESFIKAYNPDGSEKWVFVQTPRALSCVGVAVGPDGNIYAVSTEGLGVFSLTPSGTLRWTNTERYIRPPVDYSEIAFGPNNGTQQLYFYANDHVRGVTLDGVSVFTILNGLVNQLTQALPPVVAPDGSMHSVLWAYTPSGNLIWSFQSQYPYNVFTPADVGSDGTHYFVQNLSRLFALNPNGSQRWEAQLNGYFGGPIVDPLNTQLVVGSQETGDHAGYVASVASQDGHELWRVVLPIEDPTVWNPGVGIFGFNQFVNTRARFTGNAQTAYVITATATGDNNTSKSFVYSFDARITALPSPTPIPTPTATPTVPPIPTPSATPRSTPIPSATPNTTPTGTPMPTGTPASTPGVGSPPHPVNLSTRAKIRIGDQVGIGGFIITGTAPKRILIRAIGPSLVHSGITNALSDPMLELHGPGNFATITNQDWQDTQQSEIEATGIAPADDRESAIISTLPAGAYTAIVKGNGDTTGVALVELYDLDPTANSQFSNLSTRAFVSTSDQIVIAGVLLAGDNGNTQIVVRGIGPSLRPLGVSGALADPMLELRDQNGLLLAADNNWQEDKIQAADLVLEQLAPTDQLESAISASLPPGLYTALLSGTNGGTGVGVIEVYNCNPIR